MMDDGRLPLKPVLSVNIISTYDRPSGRPDYTEPFTSQCATQAI